MRTPSPTYTGHDFTQVTAPYTTSDFVSGSFTLAAPIAANQNLLNFTQPLSFSFFDGVQTITDLDVSAFTFGIGTDSTGAINVWDIDLDILVGQSGTAIITDFDSEVIDDSGNNIVGEGLNVTSHGTWVETVNSSAVPEPSTFALLGSGILGLAGVARRKPS